MLADVLTGLRLLLIYAFDVMALDGDVAVLAYTAQSSVPLQQDQQAVWYEETREASRSCPDGPQGREWPS